MMFFREYFAVRTESYISGTKRVEVIHLVIGNLKNIIFETKTVLKKIIINAIKIINIFKLCT